MVGLAIALFEIKYDITLKCSSRSITHSQQNVTTPFLPQICDQGVRCCHRVQRNLWRSNEHIWYVYLWFYLYFDQSGCFAPEFYCLISSIKREIKRGREGGKEVGSKYECVFSSFCLSVCVSWLYSLNSWLDLIEFHTSSLEKMGQCWFSQIVWYLNLTMMP